MLASFLKDAYTHLRMDRYRIPIPLFVLFVLSRFYHYLGFFSFVLLLMKVPLCVILLNAEKDGTRE